MILGDFECVLIPSTANINFGPNTKNYQDRIVLTYETYIGNDSVAKRFLDNMIKKLYIVVKYLKQNLINLLL